MRSRSWKETLTTCLVWLQRPCECYFAAAEAAIELGELDEAELHYRHLADVYEGERQEELPEYDQHSLIVDVLKRDAERFLAER